MRHEGLYIILHLWVTLQEQKHLNSTDTDKWRSVPCAFLPFPKSFDETWWRSSWSTMGGPRAPKRSSRWNGSNFRPSLATREVPVVSWTPLRSMEQLAPLALFGVLQLVQAGLLWRAWDGFNVRCENSVPMSPWVPQSLMVKIIRLIMFRHFPIENHWNCRLPHFWTNIDNPHILLPGKRYFPRNPRNPCIQLH